MLSLFHCNIRCILRISELTFVLSVSDAAAAENELGIMVDPSGEK